MARRRRHGQQVAACAAPARARHNAPMRRAATCLALAALAACAAAAPAGAASPTLEAGVGKADLTPQTRLLPRRLDARRPDRRRPAHAPVRARARARARRTRRSRSSSIDLFMVPGGMVKQIGDRLAGARLLRAEHPDLRVAHPLGPGRLRELPDAQHRGAEPADGHRPDDASSTSSTRSPPTRELYRFVLEQIAKSIVRADDDLAPAAGRLGLDRIVGAHAEPQHRGPPRQPRRSIKARGEGSAEDDPGGYAAHDRPERRRAARRQDRRAAGARRCASRSAAGRTSPTTARSRSRRSSSTTPTTTASATRVFEQTRAQGRPRCRRGRRSSTSTATRTRATCPPASTATARRHPTTSAASRRRRCCARGSAPGRALQRKPELDLALDADLLLRPDGRGRPRRRPLRGRAAVPDRVGGGARAALRRHRRRTSRTRARRSTAATRRATRSACPARRASRTTVPLLAVRDRRPADRVGARRGRPRRSARAIRAAVDGAVAGSGIERVVDLRPRQRVRPLLHDAGGVRPPALRGRQHALRPRARRT